MAAAIGRLCRSCAIGIALVLAVGLWPAASGAEDPGEEWNRLNGALIAAYRTGSAFQKSLVLLA